MDFISCTIKSYLLFLVCLVTFLWAFLWLLLCVTFLFLFLAFFLVVFLVFLATFPKLVQLNLPFLIVKSNSIPPCAMVPCALTFADPRISPLLFAIIIDRSVEVGVKPITVAWAFKVYLPSVKTVSFVSISVPELLTKLILLIEAEPLIWDCKIVCVRMNDSLN